jgi:hypothetical protein
MLIDDALAASWAREPQLTARCQSWSWFRAAFAATLPAAAKIDEDGLAQAFFSWAESVEFYAPYARIDPVDFRHFIAGLLLQKLLEASPPVLPRSAGLAVPAHATAFVLTLLQAQHAHAGAAPLQLDVAEISGRRWASFLENIAEDASSAGCFLDQMTGLEPTWQSRSLIEHRPAMRRALAQGQR